MSVPGGIGFPTPALNFVFSILPAGQRAAYSQDIGGLIFATSGQPLSTTFYPQYNPFSFNTAFASFFDGPFLGFTPFPGLGQNMFLSGGAAGAGGGTPNLPSLGGLGGGILG